MRLDVGTTTRQAYGGLLLSPELNTLRWSVDASKLIEVEQPRS